MKSNYVVRYLTLSLETSGIAEVLITDVPNESVARAMAIGLYPAVTETSIVDILETV